MTLLFHTFFLDHYKKNATLNNEWVVHGPTQNLDLA